MSRPSVATLCSSKRIVPGARPDAGDTESSRARREARAVCVKSLDTERAAAEIAPHLQPDALVLGLQNGVDNAERLKAALPHEICPAVVYVATEMAGPGHVKHHGRGELVIAPIAASQGLVTLFAGAGVPVQISDNIAGALWAKLILNCAYNALSAVSQLPYGRLVQADGVDAVIATWYRNALPLRAAKV